MKTCPRCKRETLHVKETRNALSRKDNKTYICPYCGTQEAIEEYERFLKEESLRRS